MQEFLDRVPIGKRMHNLMDGNPCALYTCLAMAFRRVNCDSLVHDCVLQSACSYRPMFCLLTAIIPKFAYGFHQFVERAR